jgi:hypothetical protein
MHDLPLAGAFRLLGAPCSGLGNRVSCECRSGEALLGEHNVIRDGVKSIGSRSAEVVQAPGIRKAGAAQADLEPPMFCPRMHRALRVTARMQEVLIRAGLSFQP